jgi:hypothetical protein
VDRRWLMTFIVTLADAEDGKRESDSGVASLEHV